MQVDVRTSPKETESWSESKGGPETSLGGKATAKGPTDTTDTDDKEKPGHGRQNRYFHGTTKVAPKKP